MTSFKKSHTGNATAGILLGLLLGLLILFGLVIWIMSHTKSPFKTPPVAASQASQPVKPVQMPPQLYPDSGSGSPARADTSDAPASSAIIVAPPAQTASESTPTPVPASVPKTIPSKPATPKTTPAKTEPRPTPKPTPEQILDSGSIEKARAQAQAQADKPAADRAASAGKVILQAGSYNDPRSADSQVAKLAITGVQAHVVQGEVNGKTVYRVRTPALSRDKAAQLRQRLSDNGITAIELPLK